VKGGGDMAKKWWAVSAIAVSLALGASSPAVAASSGGCFVSAQAIYAPCDTEPATSPELAETGSVLGHVELIVGGTGAALLVGSVLIVRATRRESRR